MAIDRKRLKRLERWREAVRRQEEVRTREAFGAYISSREDLERARGAREAMHQSLAGTVGDGAAGADVRLMAGIWEGARRRESSKAEETVRAATTLESRRQELIGARRQERILETLGDRLDEEWRQEQLLAEQKTIDDMTRKEVIR